MAIEAGNLHRCQRLVQGGADINLGYASCAGCSPLLYALHGGRFEIAHYLVVQGASVTGVTCNLWSTQGYTAFHYAASCGQVMLLKVLLEKASKVISQFETDVHPIHVAIANGHLDCFEAIMDYSRKGYFPFLVSTFPFTLLILSRNRRSGPS